MALATQSLHPWQATVRTAFAVVVGLAASWAVLVPLVGLNSNWRWVVVGGAVATALTRVLANPSVEFFLQHYFPWLSANGPDLRPLAAQVGHVEGAKHKACQCQNNTPGKKADDGDVS